MDKLIFSVVVPLYNKEKYIRNTINSVLRQSFTNFELLVIDDGSTDLSSKIIDEIDDPRLKYYYKSNEGVSSARNFGIEKAKGKYVAFLDADDEYCVEFLNKLNRLSTNFPQADALVSGFYRKNNGKQTESNLIGMEIGESRIISNFFNNWSEGAFFCSSSIAVKKSYFINTKKYFPINENMGEDQDVWFHIAINGLYAYIAEHLAIYNNDISNSLTRTNVDARIKELPSVKRLNKELLKLSSYNDCDGIKKFLNRYNLERSINNSFYGYKKEGFLILKKNIFSKNFFKLKLIAIIVLLIPNFIIRK